MSTARDRHQAAIAFVHQAREALGDNLAQAYLYGSTVRGEERPDGDIDLLLVVRDRARIDPLPHLLGEWIVRTGFVIEAMIVTPEQWRAARDRGSAFAHALRDEGEALL